MPDLDAIATKLDALLDRLGSGSQRWMTLDVAEEYSGLSGPSLRRLLAAGKLVGYRPVPGRILVDRRQLDALILSSTGRPSGGRGRVRKVASSGA